jgi:hypothetical protein
MNLRAAKAAVCFDDEPPKFDHGIERNAARFGGFAICHRGDIIAVE